MYSALEQLERDYKYLMNLSDALFSKVVGDVWQSPITNIGKGGSVFTFLSMSGDHATGCDHGCVTQVAYTIQSGQAQGYTAFHPALIDLIKKNPNIPRGVSMVTKENLKDILEIQQAAIHLRETTHSATH